MVEFDLKNNEFKTFILDKYGYYSCNNMSINVNYFFGESLLINSWKEIRLMRKYVNPKNTPQRYTDLTKIKQFYGIEEGEEMDYSGITKYYQLIKNNCDDPDYECYYCPENNDIESHYSPLHTVLLPEDIESFENNGIVPIKNARMCNS